MPQRKQSPSLPPGSSTGRTASCRSTARAPLRSSPDRNACARRRMTVITLHSGNGRSSNAYAERLRLEAYLLRRLLVCGLLHWRLGGLRRTLVRALRRARSVPRGQVRLQTL